MHPTVVLTFATAMADPVRVAPVVGTKAECLVTHTVVVTVALKQTV